MSAVYEHARALVKALRECDEVKTMKRLGEQVKNDRNQEKLLGEFRLRQFEIQATQLQGKQPSSSQIEHIQQVAKEVESHRLLKEYLSAEIAYGQVLAEVQQVLGEVYNPDVPGSLLKK